MATAKSETPKAALGAKPTLEIGAARPDEAYLLERMALWRIEWKAVLNIADMVLYCSSEK